MKAIITSLILCLLGFASLDSANAQISPTHKMGWKSAPNHAKGLRQFVHHPDFSTVSVPDVFDLSGVMPGATPSPDAVHMPAVYDQGQKGSCTANAGTAADEFEWHRQHRVFGDFSRQGLYTCSLIHDGNWPQDAGSYTGTVVWVLTNQGIGLESCFPYSKPVSTPLPKCYLPDAAKHKAITGYDIASDDHISIMVAVSKGFPVMYGGYVYQSIEGLTAANYFNPPHSGSAIGGHERLIAGYNRKLTHKFGSKTVTGFYWVRNSWGPGWGYKGYCWEPMSEVENTKINNDFAVISVTQ